MATLKELRDERLRKLEELEKLGVNPYPAHTSITKSIALTRNEFEKSSEGAEVVAAGRIISIRTHGQIAFLTIKDASGTIQLFLQASSLNNADHADSQLNFDELRLLDLGDFIEARGRIMRSRTGEITIDLAVLRILAKALRPLPGHDGFSNKEERFRRRYVDMNVNKDVYERFIRRSRFWEANREFLNQNGFSEINIPVLEHTTGGADAKPFKTHMDALNQDFYLRISHELPLKRLIGGGYEKVYDIGPRFRNEHYTEEHLPEHVAMEWYWAYADWRDGMRFMTDMFRFVFDKVYGKLQFNIHGMDVNLADEWKEIDYASAIRERYDLDVFNASLDDVKQKLKENKLEVEKADNIGRGIDKLWKNMRKDIAGPAWLVNTPLIISPLAKTNLDNPNTVQRFQPIIAGTELGNGYSELNDPLDQLNRFLEQQKMRDAGDEEAQMLDIDFVEMLEYGMPPTCGWGHSERAFWLFEGVTAREGVPFPHLRHEIDGVTKGVYPEVYANEATKTGGSRPQDFTRKIVTVVNKELEPWQVANAVAHMDAIVGNELPKEQLVSGDYFVSNDQVSIPRNSQYAIIIMRADEKELHKLHEKVLAKNLVHHVFIKEMQDTSNDEEIQDSLSNKPMSEITFFGVSFLASNEEADQLTRGLQLWR